MPCGATLGRPPGAPDSARVPGTVVVGGSVPQAVGGRNRARAGRGPGGPGSTVGDGHHEPACSGAHHVLGGTSAARSRPRPSDRSATMLRFLVHDPEPTFAARLARSGTLLGHDHAGVRAKLLLGEPDAAGMCVLTCEGIGRSAHALQVPWDAGEPGDLLLRTTLLPPRDEPYCLLTELAREQVRAFLAKGEDWHLLDHQQRPEVGERWEKARGLLADAITAETHEERNRAARASLAAAIDANERLAVAHADLLLRRRFADRPASSSTLAVRVWPGRAGERLQAFVHEHFDLVFLPLRWRDVEVEENRYRWGPLDRWMDFAREQGMAVVCGPLVDFSRGSVPDWLETWRHDFDTTRELLYDFMDRVVRRYADAVPMWNLAADVNTNENFQFTHGQMTDLVRTAALLVRQHRRRARTMIEVRRPFGEFCGRAAHAAAPIPFVTRLIQEGIHLDALGVQLVVGGHEPDAGARDLMQLSSMLDRFHESFDLPLIVSALGAPSAPVEDRASGLDAGGWHGGWTPRRQARWVQHAFAICMSKPRVQTVAWSDLYDHRAARVPTGGLLDEKGVGRPVFKALVGLRRRLRRPLGRGDGTSLVATGRDRAAGGDLPGPGDSHAGEGAHAADDAGA